MVLPFQEFGTLISNLSAQVSTGSPTLQAGNNCTAGIRIAVFQSNPSPLFSTLDFSIINCDELPGKEASYGGQPELGSPLVSSAPPHHSQLNTPLHSKLDIAPVVISLTLKAVVNVPAAV